ncbi:CueP family metal-binding protein [Carboxydochorda subterranea]|uniref:CueP family metal-binding protein n=1 Tax=Carboxydichorda subterranea TaxID=3109565 RepID=A0ABZ1BV88_9FIRM|nr:CueP family metal-binding protein [Limnochorda sp. L945t]WRP16042.1 CueP family metal-binding protein [Limnochorda sp. L945t]
MDDPASERRGTRGEHDERPGARRRAWTLGVGAVLALGLSGFAVWRLGGPSPSSEARAFARLDPVQAVALANRWRAEGKPVESSITSQALRVRWSDGQEAAVPLPPDRMYVAVAPFVSRTHPCYNHVLSSCQGELPGRRFEVTARTLAGETVFRGTVTTLPNGFFELWLPRDRELELTIRSQQLGRQGSGTLSTRAGSPTCITTIHLEPASESGSGEAGPPAAGAAAL